MTSLFGWASKIARPFIISTARDRGHEPNFPLYHTLENLSSKIVKKYYTNKIPEFCVF